MPYTLPPHAQRVFDGVLFNVWQWDQELYDGSHATYECATRHDSASMIAFSDPKTILLTEQEQPSREKPFLDVPGGRVDKGETAEHAARREFEEETGLRVGRMRHFQTIPLEGSTRFSISLFLGTDLTNHAEGSHTEPGEKIRLRPVPWEEAVRLSLNGALRQAWVMLAILRIEYDPETRRMLDDFLKPSGA
ncbi:NUDIX hydrolase [Candidatus Uhrbacteria bacterium UHB]|nr:NUDIX hydrolase [Candidatus Uhrbacteria bacterium UHB]RIL00765.1 MAG: hypothetical protein DCC77_04500 [Candidatus Uhrbacteria bacterium]